MNKMNKIEIEVPDSTNCKMSPGLLRAIPVALAKGGRDFIRQLEEFVMDYIHKLNQPAIHREKLATVEEARMMLGETRVISAAQVAGAWGLPDIFKPQFVGYTARELEEAAEANRAGRRVRLVYISGLSLVELVALRNEAHFPMVVRKDGCREWFDQLAGNISANKASRSGYYLIEFPTSRFAKMNFAEQEAKIGEVGAEFERPEDAVVLEAAFSLQMVTGEQAFALADHWGWLQWHGMRILFGPSSFGGIEIGFLGEAAKSIQRKRPLDACVVRLPRHLLRAKIGA